MKLAPCDPASTPRLGEVLDFMSLLWRLDHALQRTSKRMESTLGVTGPQRLVLRIVGRFPGIPAGHLARLLHVHPSTLTGILKRLEHQGLVHRRSDPRDGRRSLLALTAAGRQFDVETEGTIEAAMQRVLESASRARIDAARELLEAMSSVLDAAQPSGASQTHAPSRRKHT
jgi:MarR family transcriptional regulator, organic hydroperoxide resistance regulator